MGEWRVPQTYTRQRSTTAVCADQWRGNGQWRCFAIPGVGGGMQIACSRALFALALCLRGLLSAILTTKLDGSPMTTARRGINCRRQPGGRKGTDGWRSEPKRSGDATRLARRDRWEDGHDEIETYGANACRGPLCSKLQYSSTRKEPASSARHAARDPVPRRRGESSSLLASSLDSRSRELAGCPFAHPPSERRA